MRIRVYVKPEPTSRREPECRQCIMTEKVMEQKGIDYERIVMDDTIAGDLREMGFLSAPVVMVGDHGYTDAWAGFQPAKINELASLIQQ